MKSVWAIIVTALGLFATNLLHAQLQFSSDDLAAIEATTPTSADALPIVGTFYSAAYPQYPPAPEDTLGWPAWDLGNLGGIEIYMLDDLDASGGGFHAMDDSYIPPGATNEFSFYESTNTYAGFPTNGLWLQITNLANNTVYANLNNGTDFVYEIYSTTNLAAVANSISNWDIAAEVFPCTNTNSVPFTVCMGGRPDLFLWARDWTGITSNGNETPDWWFYYWFGTNEWLWADGNEDIQENTFSYDFSHHQDPDYITFSLQTTNISYTANPVRLAVNVQYGLPFYEAVLINDTNAADVVWKPFNSTNLTLNLSNGLCSVFVGLRGRPAESQQTWRLVQLTLNSSPLTLTVTNPVSTTVSQPLIQVQGYASKPLASLTFDISNAAGIFSNQTGYVTSQYCDTNLQMVTTNYFQCYDVRLTNGPNVVTLHATDMADETASASEGFTLNYSANTNPPALGIIWPTNETYISGTNFNLQAQVSDDTATVTAQIVDTSGDTNAVQALVERSGVVWANNLPLASGTNILTVTATDAGGYSTTTNITLVQSAVMVAVNPLSGGQLNQSSVTVTGTVNNTNEALYVNGVQATVNSDGTWEADGVPVSATGTATINVQASSGGSEVDGSQSASQEQPPMIVLADYQMQTGDSQAGNGENQNAQWDYAAGGNWGTMSYPTAAGFGGSGGGGWSIIGHDPDIPPDGSGYTAPVVTSDQGETFGPTWQISDASATEGNQNLQTKTSTTLMIVPGDQTAVGGTALYLVELAGTEFSDLANDWNISGLNLGGANQGDLADPPEWFEINGQPLLGLSVTNTDGTLPGIAVVSAPAGTPVTLTLTSTQYYTNNDQTFPNSDVQAMNFQLTVVSNSAVQVNGLFSTNWVAVKATNNYVIVQAEVNPANATVLSWLGTNIVWSGGTPVPGNPLQCEVSTASPTNVIVIASLGQQSVSLGVWVIWADLTITCGTSDTIDPLNDAANLDSGNWPPDLGGGNNLGPLSHLQNPNLTYALTIGKMQAKATLQPAGVGEVVGSGFWAFRRHLEFIVWDNGVLTGVNTNSFTYVDAFAPDWMGLDPTLTEGNIYDLDAPSCPILMGIDINHTSEVYDNFEEFATVTLGGVEQPCSNTNTWSYEAQIDADNTTNEVQLNAVSTSLINLPSSPHYTTR